MPKSTTVTLEELLLIRLFILGIGIKRRNAPLFYHKYPSHNCHGYTFAVQIYVVSRNPARTSHKKCINYSGYCIYLTHINMIFSFPTQL